MRVFDRPQVSHNIINTMTGTRKCGRGIILQVLDTETAVMIFFAAGNAGFLTSRLTFGSCVT